MSRVDRPDAFLIAGPSASGKSALAIALAERIDGVVVNADSMQVYADLRILTARPSEADLARARHALFGTVDGATAHSVSRWLADAGRVLEDVREAGRVPIVVGGTGLYLKALVHGLSAIPAVPPGIRADVRAAAQGRSPKALHAALAERDPVTAQRLRPSDPQRIIRALEVHAATGRSLASFHDVREAPLLDLARCPAVVLAPERPVLRARLDQRFDAMMAEGALAEVGRLAARRLDPALPVMRALGVPHLLRHLRGDIGLDEAVALAKSEIRRYAKRQETFARHQLAGFQPMPPEQAEAWLQHASSMRRT